MTRQSSRPKGLSVEKIHQALLQAHGSPTGAARLLGVTRNTINYWMEQGRIERKVEIVKDADAAA